MDENSSKSHGINPELGWWSIVAGLIILVSVLTNTIIAELFLTVGGLFGLVLLFIGIDLIRPRSLKKPSSHREHRMGEANNDLFKDIEKKINSLKKKMVGDSGNIKKLDSLLWLSQGVARFSHDCSECNNLPMQITNIVNDLADWPDITDRQNDNYVKTDKGITKHLRKIHNYGGLDKSSNYGIAITCWIISAILVFIGIGFVAMRDSSQQNEAMLYLFALLGMAPFITGIVFFVKGFLTK